MRLRLALVMLVAIVSVAVAGPPLPVYRAVVQAETAETLEMWREGDSFDGVYFPTVRASSTLNGKDYSANKVLDGLPATAWVEGTKGDGIGEWLEFTIDRTGKNDEQPNRNDVAVTGLTVMNGYRKSRDLWNKNGRVKRLRLSVNGKAHCDIDLENAYAHQTVLFKRIPLPKNKKTVLRLTLVSTYPGTKYKDTALSEVVFEGEGVF